MKPDAVILGIESSCDETAAAVLRADGTILAEAVFSQQQEHAAFGGVVPEIAARAHLQHLPGLVAKVMHQAGMGYAGLNAVAATAGPGLIGGLIVGASFAKGVALAHGLPFLAINHLEAHALDMAPQVTALVVAGGVAANGAVRAALGRLAKARGLPMLAPPLSYCTDNAVMVAWAGFERLRHGLVDPLSHNPRPRWPL